jgi:hypothetical protein
MAATAATAICGRRVRVQSRVRAVPRGLWRLLVLLGLAWIGCLLLGGTAYAAERPAPSPDPASTPLAPVIDQVLGTTDALVPALPVRELVGGVTKPNPVGQVPAAVTTTVAEIPPAAVTTVAPAHAADATATAVTAVHEVGKVDAPELPRLADIVDPVVTQTTAQLRSTVAATVDLVEKATAPIPVVASITQQVGGTTRDAADGASRLVNVTTYAAAGGVDAVLDQTSSALAPVLSPVLQTLTAISQIGAGGSASASASGVSGVPGSTLGFVAGAPTPTGAAPAAWSGAVLNPQSYNGPAVPPPDATASAASSTVQSASAIDTTLSVPVSGAGSTASGSGSGTGSAGGPDLAKVLVELLSRRTAKSVAPKTEAPVRPMPGTPLADPGFSPD